MGNTKEESKRKKVITFIKNSYIYRLIKRLLSLLSSLLLIVLLTLGGLMFYFNTKGQAAAKQGQQYIPPFGLYTIISGSMEPVISVYDVVVAVQKDDLSTIKVGDVITFISTWDLNYGTTVTHRVTSVIKNENGDYSFTTKGDANQAQDGAYVTRDNLIGKVIFKLPQLGRIQFFLATKMGWFVVVFIPALAVIIWDIIKIFKLKVLNNNIEAIKTTEESKTTYFENEVLDSRDINEKDLQKTVVIKEESIQEIKSKSIPKNTDGIKRKPIPKRKETTTAKKAKTNNRTNKI